MNTCICTAESLHCSPETATTLLIGCTLIKNKKFKFGGKKRFSRALNITWVGVEGCESHQGDNLHLHAVCVTGGDRWHWRGGCCPDHGCGRPCCLDP